MREQFGCNQWENSLIIHSHSRWSESIRNIQKENLNKQIKTFRSEFRLSDLDYVYPILKF